MTEVRESFQELKELVERGERKSIVDFLDFIGAAETARAISRLDEQDQQRLFQLLAPEEAAEIIEDLPEQQAAEIIEDMPEQKAADIIEELPSDEQADILQALDEQDAEGILQRMGPEEALEARQLLSYDPATAGGIMMTEFLAFDESWTVADVLSDLEQNSEKYHGYDVLYGYVVDKAEKLKGVIRFRDLLLSGRSIPVTHIMTPDMIFVPAEATLEELERLFERYEFFALPVVDLRKRLVGIVRRSDLLDRMQEKADRTFLRASGLLAGEEFRSMPLRERAPRRLILLLVSISLNLISASVINANADTLHAMITLAVFLPMLSDLSGCQGNQAVAVSIRELSVGLIKPHEYSRVLVKEVSVGALNGLLLGSLLGVIAAVWKGDAVLGFVIGGALFINSMVAVALGGSIPLLWKSLRIDPAIASSPVLTTLTDTCGFFMALQFASLALHVMR